MEFLNKALWEKGVAANQDDYGACVYRYAQRWAEMIEKAMADGAQLEDIAENLNHEADSEGITGFMSGAAVGVLSACWKHGEQLRLWHNLKGQIHDEGAKANKEKGAVLNPAVLCIDV